MYAQPQTGATTTATVAPTLHVGTYRRALLAVVIGNDLFTDAEQVKTNHSAHECADAAKLALWTRNALRVAKEREAAAQPTGNLLADLANPKFVAQHGSKQAAADFPTLMVADAYKAAESLRQAFTAAQQPALAPQAATAEQCSEVHKLALHPALTLAERASALLRLPTLTQAEATAFIAWLTLRTAYGPGVMPQPVGAGLPATPPTAPALATPRQISNLKMLAWELAVDEPQRHAWLDAIIAPGFTHAAATALHEELTTRLDNQGWVSPMMRKPTTAVREEFYAALDAAPLSKSAKALYQAQLTNCGYASLVYATRRLRQTVMDADQHPVRRLPVYQAQGRVPVRSTPYLRAESQALSFLAFNQRASCRLYATQPGEAYHLCLSNN